MPRTASFIKKVPSQAIFMALPGLDGRDVAFMERLRNLAREALTWEHLSDEQRLVWAAALELDAVPVQEGVWVCRGSFCACRVRLCSPFRWPSIMSRSSYLALLDPQFVKGTARSALCHSKGEMLDSRPAWCTFPLALQELPPWFLERQNITRRPPGRRKGN